MKNQTFYLKIMATDKQLEHVLALLNTIKIKADVVVNADNLFQEVEDLKQEVEDLNAELDSVKIEMGKGN